MGQLLGVLNGVILLRRQFGLMANSGDGPQTQSTSQSQCCSNCLIPCLRSVEIEQDPVTRSLMDSNDSGDPGHDENCNGSMISRVCWNSLEKWFCRLKGNQGSAMLSLQYFLLTFTMGVGLTFAHTSSYQGRNESNSDIPCQKSSRETHMEGYMSFLLLTSVVGFLVCICCQRQIIGQCCRMNPNRADYLLIGTVIFGLFSTIWFIFRLIAEEDCLQDKSSVELMYSTMQIIFIMSEIHFLSAHSNVRFVDNSLMKMFLMHVVATNFCLWFRITAGEAVDRAKEVPSICNSTAFNQKCIKHSRIANDTIGNLVHLRLLSDVADAESNATTAKLLEDAMHVLYPCVAEFCLSASGILFKMWLFTIRTGTNESCGNSCLRENPLCCCLHDDDERATPEISIRQRGLNRILLSAPILTGLLGAVAIACIAMLLFFRHNNSVDLDLTVSYIYDILQLVTTLFALVAAIVGISSFPAQEHDGEQQHAREQQPDTEQTNTGRDIEHAREVIVETALLMFSLAGLFISEGLELTASLDTHNMFRAGTETCLHMLNTERATGFLSVITGILQTRFIIGSLTAKGRPAEQAGDGHNNILDRYALHARQLAARVLLICNLTLWLTKTFELSGLYCHPLYYRFYLPWLQLSNIFYPLWIFFHFHSAASCFDIVC